MDIKLNLKVIAMLLVFVPTTESISLRDLYGEDDTLPSSSKFTATVLRTIMQGYQKRSQTYRKFQDLEAPDGDLQEQFLRPFNSLSEILKRSKLNNNNTPVRTVRCGQHTFSSLKQECIIRNHSQG
ncbi:hypothetical protein ACF0H5_015745 [Mactra antiquata]